LKSNLIGFFFTDADLLRKEGLKTDPPYKFMREQGFEHCTELIIQASTGDIMIFDIARRCQDGPIRHESMAQLNLLTPHLSRSALLASRIGLNEMRSAANTLSDLGLAAAVLSANRHLIAANQLMQQLLPSTVEERAMGRIHFTDKKADLLFTSALTNALAAQTNVRRDKAVFSIPIPSKADQPAMVAHVLPIRRAAHDIFHAAASIVIITPVCSAQVVSESVVQGLFDLTAAEARIASRIAGGETISEIAFGTNTSEGTIRSQLKSVFGKIGVSRQADLVGLLGSISSVRPPTYKS
jgi:DNA-binding CsgD family transcriptional regulator